MESPRILSQEPKRHPEPVNRQPNTLSPCSSGRRSTSSYASSPEFEFWMVRNPSSQQTDLLSADELFVNGFLLPLHLIPNKQPDFNPPPEPDPPSSEPSISNPEHEPSPHITSEPVPALTASKRWRDIFKKDKGKTGTSKNQEEKEKKKEKKGQSQGGASSAELNINIWPFSRSRSAGNSGTRPRMFAGSAGARKVSSAPCSRSNSAGESKTRAKWPSSPGRPGVHLGRSSPVWQVRRTGSALKSSEALARSGEKSGSKKEVTERRRSKTESGTSGKTKVLNLNVPMCIGYRHHLSCRSDENGAVQVGVSGESGGRSNGADANVGNGGSLFSLRNLFTKKVY